MPSAQLIFGAVSALACVAVILIARRVRGPLYARFATVLLGVHSLVAVALFPYFAAVWPLYVYLHVTVYVHIASLVAPRMRPAWWRVLVSVPGSWFAASTFIAFPWAIASLFGVPHGAFVPYVVGFVGMIDSLWAREEVVHLVLDRDPIDGLRRHPRGKREARTERPLRVVQITDPHLGPFMSVARLRAICERAARKEPDLVLLTGDFLTMESQSDARHLTEALAPLRPLAGRTFACLGNHDHEAPRVVAAALKDAGVELLVDRGTRVHTAIGDVDILGYDFTWRGRKEHLARVTAEHPREEGVPRIALLHDPGAFRQLPDGAADLVLSGHTHGGQVGFLRLGLAATFVSMLTSIPDHGLWALGRARLYVHRGTGHYGFPLRVGVPSEESVLHLHLPWVTAAADEAE